jgi:hypothetical protein
MTAGIARQAHASLDGPDGAGPHEDGRLAMAFFLSYWILNGGEETTIEYWFGNPPQYQGPMLAVPVPRLSSGPFDVTSYGTKVDLGGIIYRLTVANRNSSAQAFDIAGGVLS